MLVAAVVLMIMLMMEVAVCVCVCVCVSVSVCVCVCVLQNAELYIGGNLCRVRECLCKQVFVCLHWKWRKQSLSVCPCLCVARTPAPAREHITTLAEKAS